ncbi:hypothetical protein R3P38DRAFT_2905002 [Favolaschia claudopus]|uniref:F-box domain-containing protein n=1 Tax=Favolaschia claudopus TaxID=2862362 RepID=A0AAW0CK56_9AGAR
MSLRPAGPYLGHLSNRENEYGTQHILVQDNDGRLRHAPFARYQQTFPAELLAEIFLHLLDTASFSTPCHVCHRWREVALSTPRLWSNLDIDLCAARTSKSYVDFQHIWLGRARDAPLSISLVDDWEWAEYFPVFGKPEPDASAISLMQAIGRTSRRWQKITIDFKDRILMEALFSTADRDFPLLEQMSLDSVVDPTTPGAVDSNAPLPVSFVNAPKLYDITTFKYREMLAPWTQITTFWSFSISVRSVYDVLGSATRLVYGFFILTGDGEALDTAPCTLECVHLQSLSFVMLREWDPESIIGPKAQTILPNLKAPALRNLSLRFHPSSGLIHNTSPLLHFLSQSSLRLRSLELSCFPTKPENLYESLKAAPSLVHLELFPFRFGDLDLLFKQLTGDTRFLPKLESIRIYFTSNTGRHAVNESDLARMLSWRWAAAGVAQLHCFHMHKSEYLSLVESSGLEHEEASSVFQRLRDDGMDLRLETQDSVSE